LLDIEKTPTVKLPSYAACLKAEINPKNYRTLNRYYEIAVKDPKIASLNKNHILGLSMPSKY